MEIKSHKGRVVSKKRITMTYFYIAMDCLIWKCKLGFKRYQGWFCIGTTLGIGNSLDSSTLGRGIFPWRSLPIR
jgi:hypothetical protein